jgi:hypothetical protein
MPNWCTNQVILRHSDKSKLEAICEEVAKGDAAELFQSLRPMPLNEEENWYTWRLNNWGTKWDANVFHITENDNELVVDFDTAWGPPIELYEHMLKDGWEIEAVYYEPGMGFVGQFRGSGDVVWDNDSYEWNYDAEEPFKHIPEELVEWAGLRDSLAEYKEENQ